jgi:hypothetical protein
VAPDDKESRMDTHQTDNSGLRLAELIASLSLAIDLGLGQLMENFLRTCLLAVRLGKVLGVSEQDLVDIYYLGLIQHLGCTAYADETAAIFGDEPPLVYKKQPTTLLPQQLLNIRCHPPESLQLFIFLQEMRIARFGSFYSSNHQVPICMFS